MNGQIRPPVNNSRKSVGSNVLEVLFLLSLFLLPPLVIKESLPAVYGTDLLLPVVCILIWQRRATLSQLAWKGLGVVTTIYCGCIVLSIVVNGRMGMIPDWFELYKVGKFFLIALYAALSFDPARLDRLLKGFFVLLVVFNVFHYFDLFGFNEHVIRYYTGYIQWSSFGINSLGEPDTRRILGTVGNPNNNALLFLFFVVWFAKQAYSKADKAWFYTAVFMVLTCQSRTGLAATVAVLILTAVYFRPQWKTVVTDSAVYVGMYCILWFGGNVYLNSIGNFGLIKNSFAHGRIEMWTILLKGWKEKPLFGYAPYKEVFYSNNWYSEGEYVLMLWRYGIVGVLGYLAWLTYAVGKVGRRFRSATLAEFRWLAFTVVVMIGCVTNNPTLDFVLLLQFAILAGLALSQKPEKAIQA